MTQVAELPITLDYDQAVTMFGMYNAAAKKDNARLYEKIIKDRETLARALGNHLGQRVIIKDSEA